jgi:hypothetical protein
MGAIGYEFKQINFWFLNLGICVRFLHNLRFSFSFWGLRLKILGFCFKDLKFEI